MSKEEKKPRGRPTVESPWEVISLRVDPLVKQMIADLTEPFGDRSLTIRYILAQWHISMRESATANNEALTDDDWEALGQLNDLYTGEEFLGGADRLRQHWGQRLSRELRDTGAIATSRKVAKFSRAQGFALMMALRYFWANQDAGIVVCQEPSIWLTNTAKEDK